VPDDQFVRAEFALEKKKQMPFVAGGKRQSVRAVMAALLAFIEAKRRTLTEQTGGAGAGFSQERQRAFPEILDCVRSLLS